MDSLAEQITIRYMPELYVIKKKKNIRVHLKIPPYFYYNCIQVNKHSMM